MVILKNYMDFLKCQDLFLRYCLHFQQNISSPIELLAHHKIFITKEPELTHFVYQRALEVTYEKKRFSNKDLIDLFENRFNVIDMYAGLNNDFSDMSTVNSLFILNQIQNTYNLFGDRKVTVISTPLEYGTARYYSIQNKGATQQYVKLSKLTTGNTNAEIQIDNRLYDIKHTGHTSTSQNHIYPWTYERIEKEYGLHLKSLLEYLENGSQMPYTIKNKLIPTLKAIIADNTVNIHEKTIKWNEFIMKQFDNIPEQYGIPLVIQMTHYPYTIKSPKKLLEKVHISPEVLDDKQKAIKAITGVTVVLGKKYNVNAHEMSNGIIPLATISNETEQLD